MTAASQPQRHGGAVSWFVVKSTASESSLSRDDALAKELATDGAELMERTIVPSSLSVKSVTLS